MVLARLSRDCKKTLLELSEYRGQKTYDCNMFVNPLGKLNVCNQDLHQDLYPYSTGDLHDLHRNTFRKPTRKKTDESIQILIRSY